MSGKYCKKVFVSPHAGFPHVVPCIQHDGRPSPVSGGVCSVCGEKEE